MEQVLAALGGAIGGVHPFVLYLVCMNVMTFVLFAIDYAIACRNQDEDTGLMNGGLMTLFAVAGGAAGMLIALVVFTRGRMNKHNIAWWFSAIACLVAWAAVLLVWSGTVKVSTDSAGTFDMTALTALGVYYAVVNVATLVVFCIDKRRAASHGSRIPEAVLLGLSLAGGALGGIVGMRAAHHKTRKWYFRYGLSAFVALHAALLVLAHLAGAF